MILIMTIIIIIIIINGIVMIVIIAVTMITITTFAINTIVVQKREIRNKIGARQLSNRPMLIADRLWESSKGDSYLQHTQKKEKNPPYQRMAVARKTNPIFILSNGYFAFLTDMSTEKNKEVKQYAQRTHSAENTRQRAFLPRFKNKRGGGDR